MQKINFQNLPNTTTPVNATNLNTLQTNVENEFNKLENYLTTEQVIGKWIDGKPLYRKVISAITPTGVNYEALVDNVASLINAYGFIYYDGTNSRPINMMGINNNDSFFRTDFAGTNNRIYSNISTDMQNKKYILTLEYTKTTD